MKKKLYELSDNRVIGRPHIATLMVKKRYVDTVDYAFKRYIGDGRCCFVSGDDVSVEETIQIIHQAHGKAFLAHPHLISKQWILRDLYEMDFDGMECYYAMFGHHYNLKWVNIAKKLNLLISGGSDFHGELKPHIPLGASYVDAENFELIERGSYEL